MNIDQNECIIQVKLDLIQLVSMEPEVFLPSTIIGHVTQYCNHVVSSPDKNNNIKKVYTRQDIASVLMRCCINGMALLDVNATLYERHDVASTLMRCCINILCQLGSLPRLRKK